MRAIKIFDTVWNSAGIGNAKCQTIGKFKKKKKKKNPARTIPVLLRINASIFTDLNYNAIDISQFFKGPMLNI